MGKYDFGDLNPRTPRQNVREITGETTGIGYIRHGAINHNKRDVNKKKKEMLAQVLKVYDAPEDMKRSRAKSAFNFWGVFDVETSDDNVVTIKARIIESFGGACLPEPSEIPLNPKSEHYNNDLKIVDMYPKFVSFPGENGQLPPKPRAGQIVKVDFEDRINFVGGMYLGVLDNNELVGTITAGPQAGIGSKPKNSARDAVEGTTPPPPTRSPPPPRQTPKPWTGDLNGGGWAFPTGDVELTVGAHGIETLAMVGGNPKVRAFMRMITIGEDAAAHTHGIDTDKGKSSSPYQTAINGHITRNPQKAHRRMKKTRRKNKKGEWYWVYRNYFVGYSKGHPGVGRKGSNACGRYQFIGSHWTNMYGWRGNKRPGEPERSKAESRADFSPGNQDWCIYHFVTKGRGAPGWGRLDKGLEELLEDMGDSPDTSNQEHLVIWKQLFKTPGKAGGRRAAMNISGGGKGMGGIWASLPYACYPKQSCYGLEGDRGCSDDLDPKCWKRKPWNGDASRFKKKLRIYGDLLREELQIASQNALVASRSTPDEAPSG